MLFVIQEQGGFKHIKKLATMRLRSMRQCALLALSHLAVLTLCIDVGRRTSAEVKSTEQQDSLLRPRVPDLGARSGASVNDTNLGVPRVHCNGDGGPQVVTKDCNYVIRHEIQQSGPQLRPLDWPRRRGKWTHCSCRIAVLNNDPEQADIFSISEVAFNAQRIVGQCRESSTGGSAEIGHYKGFYVDVSPTGDAPCAYDAPPVGQERPANTSLIIGGSTHEESPSSDLTSRDNHEVYEAAIEEAAELEKRYYNSTTDAPLAKQPLEQCLPNITTSTPLNPSDCLHILERFNTDGLNSLDGKIPQPLPDDSFFYPNYNISIPQSQHFRSCYMQIRFAPENITLQGNNDNKTIPPVDTDVAINIGNRLYNNCIIDDRPSPQGGVAILDLINGYKGYQYPLGSGPAPGSAGNAYIAFTAWNNETQGPADSGALKKAVESLFAMEIEQNELGNGASASVSAAPTSPTPATNAAAQQASGNPPASATKGVGAQFGFWGP